MVAQTLGRPDHLVRETNVGTSMIVSDDSTGAIARSPECRLRIGIATSGRFHLLDLAREYDAASI